MSNPIGGSLAALMADGDALVDNWVASAKEQHASTPELVANLMLQMDMLPNKSNVFCVMLATAIQRLACAE